MKTRVIIWDIPGTAHAEEVKRAVVEGYGIDMNISDNVQITNDWEAIEELLTDPGGKVEALIHPYGGLNQSHINRAHKYYPQTLFFYALHNNEFKQVHKFEEHEHPVVVVVGAGDAERRNNTSWGYGLEFWDWDFIYNYGSDQASFSLGFICGKMLKLKDRLTKKYSQAEYAGNKLLQERLYKPIYKDRSRTTEIDWWVTRHIMRQTCIRDEPNRDKNLAGIWDIHNGYGRVDWRRGYFYATKYISNIPKDPYIIELGEPGEIKAQLYGTVEIQLSEIPGAVSYELFRNGVGVEKTDILFINDTLKIEGVYDYTYLGYDRNGTRTGFSKPTQVKYILEKEK